MIQAALPRIIKEPSSRLREGVPTLPDAVPVRSTHARFCNAYLLYPFDCTANVGSDTLFSIGNWRFVETTFLDSDHEDSCWCPNRIRTRYQNRFRSHQRSILNVTRFGKSSSSSAESVRFVPSAVWSPRARSSRFTSTVGPRWNEPTSMGFNGMERAIHRS